MTGLPCTGRLHWIFLLLLLPLLLPESAFGQSGTVYVESVGNATVGDQVSVSVRSEDIESEVELIQLVLNYDPSGLDFENFTDQLDSADLDWSQPEEGEIRVGWVTTSDDAITLPDGGALFTLEFTFGGGEQIVSFDVPNCDIQDENGSLNVSYENGRIQEGSLPVEMMSFDAFKVGENRVRLSWTTASEQNNSGFTIQHRRTSKSWKSDGFVDSAAPGGTTSEPQDYRFTLGDLEPGTYDFRLVQTDLDGSETPSKVVSVVIGVEDGLHLSPPSPHPVSGPSQVVFVTKEATPTRLSLFNLLGQRVATLYKGTPTPKEQVVVSLEGNKLSSGTYLLRLRTENRMRTQRLTVVR